VIAETKSLIQQ